MSGEAKAKQQSAQGASAPARSLARSKAKKGGRKLPIRSSPVSTAPSLRTTLASLQGESAKARASRTAARAPLPFARKPVLQELEPRLLLSADLNPLATDALLATPSTLPAEFRSLVDEGKPSVVTSAAVAPIQRSNELVFVDTATPDYQKLVEDMRESAVAEGRRLEFVLIDAWRDGVHKITETLTQRKDLDAIHIVSHASDGAVQLGSTTLDFETLLERAGQIKGWGQALTEDGDILLYGCDLAATQQGQSLLEALSRLTGADVAASEDKTGAAARGGDWDLEFKTGAIESLAIVSLPAQREWDHLLATYTVTNTNDAGGGSLRQAIIDAETLTPGVPDIITFAIPGAGLHTINLTSALPTISDTVTIDATTEGGWTAATPMIELNGAGAGAGAVGLTITASNSTVQGLVINRFASHGILISGGDNNVIRHNFIGTNAAGNSPYGAGFGNGEEGIRLEGGASGNLIGGPNAGNTVAGNDNGAIRITGAGSDGNRVQGNWFGTNSAGDALGQGFGNAEMDNGASGNTIGGVNAGEGNVVAYADDDGILVYSAGSQNNAILGNSVYSNDVDLAWDSNRNGDGNGIDLNIGSDVLLPDHEATPNDGAGDGDAGPNNLQNFPSITGVTTDDTYVRITGSFATAAGSYRVEFFSSPAVGVGTGYREGRTFLGFANITKGAGTTNFDYTFRAAVAAGQFVTATATRSNSTFTQFFETSEFSQSYGTAAASANFRVEGTILEDVDGDADVSLADGTVGVAGATVHLYTNVLSAPLYLGSATTDANGRYGFIGLANNTYYVAVDSKSIRPAAALNAGFTAGDVWADQTYGSAGAAYFTGTLPLDITDFSFLAAPGALYGGAESPVGPGGGLSDDISNPVNFEHVTRAVVSGGNVANVDSGFSFSAITNNRGDNADDDASFNRMQQGSLRQFILNSNAISGVQASDFSIGAAGSTQTITAGALLPGITDTVLLDAWTQGAGAYTGPPLVVLDGNDLAGDGLTLSATADASLIRGFVVRNFGDDGILIEAGSDGNTVSGNYIGGLNAGGTGAGVALRNAGDGIEVLGAGNTIGGTGAGERNLISENGVDGLRITGAGATANVVVGNYVGLDAAGTAPLGNGILGIELASGASGNTIGGTTAAARNVIADNRDEGIYLNASSSNLIQGNYIGTDWTGTVDLGNGESGIWVSAGSSSNIIGGAAAGAGNLISGNDRAGIEITDNSDTNTLRGNLIGTDASGTGALGNSLHGVWVAGGAAAGSSPTTISVGGILPGEGNTIAFNGGDGVLVSGAGAAGIGISGNSIHSNAELGIDLVGGTEGVSGWTANDGVGTWVGNDHDPDAGPNTLQNYPSLSGAVWDGATLWVSGSLEGTGGGANYRIHVYASSALDATGHGEGERYLGAFNVVNIGGSVLFNNQAIVPAGAVAAGDWITVTAMQLTGPDRNTSEFSVGIQAQATGGTITGTVYEDVVGDGAVGGDSGAAGATVHLYRDGGDGLADGTDDVYVGNTLTNASGVYTFNPSVDATYWVVVDSKTIAPGAGFNNALTDPDNVWAEQTYAAANAVADGAAGAVRAVSFNGTYQFDTTGGAFYGGMQNDGLTADADSAGTLAGAEHVQRVTVSGGATVGGVDSGFSFNVVTSARGDNTDDDGVGGTDRLQQGTLRQFILNANAVAGGNEMRFVPAVATNESGGGGNWWTINVAAALPAIADANTTLDGTAYASADGVTVLDPNAGQVGAGGTVGVDGLALSQIARPELELDGANAFAGSGIVVDAGGAIIRGLAINRFGTAALDAQIQVNNTVTGAAGEALITGNLVGTNADGSNAAGSERIGIFVLGAGTVTNNYVAYVEGNGVSMSSFNLGIVNTEQVNVVDNEIAFANFNANSADAISDVSDNALIRGNYIHDYLGGLPGQTHRGKAIEMWYGVQNALVENNTIANMRMAGIGINDGAANNVIRRNIITGTDGVGGGGAGILITGFDYTVFGSPPAGNRITENSIYGNAGLGIDIDAYTGAQDFTRVGDGVTANDAPAALDGDTGAQGLQNFPVLARATTNGTQVRFQGMLDSAASTAYRIEFFASAAADGSGYGEGQRFLGFVDVTTDAAGHFDIDTTQNWAVAAGEIVSATATDLATGSTSEFGPNATALAGATVQGTVLHDVDGDADVTLADGTLTFAGATVRVFLDDGDDAIDAGDMLLSTVTTSGAGVFDSGLVANGTLWVVIDSATLTSGAAFNPTYDASWIWAEQTYGDDSSTLALDLGARYGGRNAAASDAAVAASPVNSEHVSRVELAGVDVAGIDSGFSFNAVVNTVDDAAGAPGNRTVQGSLRQFIINANAIDNLSFGLQSSNFSIGSGAVTIAPTSALPEITDAVILDATTQEGFNPATDVPIVQLRGDSAGAGADGFFITGGGSTVRGFVINRFQATGIEIDTGGGNVIAGNYIGTNAAGTADLGNTTVGVTIRNSAGNTIGGPTAADRNVISGNNSDGVSIQQAGSVGNVVQGNYIGLNAAGDAPIGNSGDGVDVDNGATNTLVVANVIAASGADGVEVTGATTAGTVIQGNRIGANAAGTATATFGNLGNGIILDTAGATTVGGGVAGAGNLISGNAIEGISVVGTGGHAIAGNLIGTDVNGTADFGNTGRGINLFNSANNAIGGTTALERNVISGNGNEGILVEGAGATGNLIRGNYIGVRGDLGGPLGNANEGIQIMTNANGNTVGGAAPGAGNVIGGNNRGVTLDNADNNVVQGNFIGTDPTGALNFGNTLWGVEVRGDADGSLVGGVNAGEGNTIAFNGRDGVVVRDAASGSNSLLGNSIYSNVELGIDLWPAAADDGATANDPGDGDSGANALQNRPVLTAATVGPGTITIQGSLNSTASIDFRIEFFVNSSGDPEGRIFLGSINRTTDGAGNVSFTTPAFAAAVAAGDEITATATRSNAAFNAFFETSEFSAAVAAAGANTAPVANADAYIVDEDAALTVGWWDLDWTRRQQLTLANSFGGAENLADFPVLVILNSGNIDYAQTQNDGGDLRFLDADGTPLEYEVERWDEAGNSYVWVRVPQVDTTGSDFIWMYYGNAAAADGQRPENVWSANGHSAVYHLGDAGPAINDSTVNDFDGTALNGVAVAAGQVGLAQSFDGVNDIIDPGALRSFVDGASAATLSAWISPDQVAAGDRVILSASINNGGVPATASRVSLEQTGTDVRFIVRSDDTVGTVTTITTNTSPLAAGSWYYLSASVDLVADTVTIYVNGVAQTTTGAINLPGTSFVSLPSAASSIGANETNINSWFDGRIDEARMATVARTSGWVEADYRAMTGSFVTSGGEQAAPAQAGVLDNDTDADGDPLTAILVAGPANGALTLDADGTFLYTPNANFNGVDTFTYRANDGTVNGNVATVTITVNPVNDAPVLDGAQSPALIAESEDAGAPVGAVGTLVSQLVDFASPPGQVDNVTDVDAAPQLGIAVTAADTANGAWWYSTDGGTNWNALGAVSDASARLLSADASTRLYFQPDPDWNGALAAAITFRAWDRTTGANGGLADTSTNGGTTAFSTATDTASLAVTSVDDLPAATADVYAATEDTPLVIGAPGVLANDTGLGDGVATVTLVGPVTGGGVALNNDGSFTFTPTADFNGAASFTYRVTDADGDFADALVTINVAPVNDTPVNTLPPGPLGATEDTTLAVGGISIADPDGGAIDVSLSVANGTLTVSLAGGATLTAGANGSGTLTLSGTVAQINAALASLGYQGLANYFGPDTLSVTSSDGTLSDNDMVAINVAAVNDAPILANNSFTIDAGVPLVLSGANLSASDIEDGTNLTFSVGAVANGYFTLSGAPASSFTQADVLAGLVQFVPSGAAAPSFSILVSDSGGTFGPFAANIVFNGGGGGFTPPPPPTGIPPGSNGIPPLSNPSGTLPPSPTSGPSFSAFLRGPTTPREAGGEEDIKVESLAMQVAQPPSGVLKTDRVFVPNMGLPAVRAQMDTIDTKPQRVEPLRAELRNEPLPLDEEDRQRIEVVLSSVRITGLAISVGAVWWAARAAGLVASLLSATPAWRHVDPLPVLGRDEQDKEKWDEVEENDQEKKDDEHRAAWVLEEREAGS